MRITFPFHADAGYRLSGDAIGSGDAVVRHAHRSLPLSNTVTRSSMAISSIVANAVIASVLKFWDMMWCVHVAKLECGIEQDKEDVGIRFEPFSRTISRVSHTPEYCQTQFAVAAMKRLHSSPSKPVKPVAYQTKRSNDVATSAYYRIVPSNPC